MQSSLNGVFAYNSVANKKKVWTSQMFILTSNSFLTAIDGMTQNGEDTNPPLV